VKPKETCLANTPIETKVRCNYDTEQSNMVTRPYDIGATAPSWSDGVQPPNVASLCLEPT